MRYMCSYRCSTTSLKYRNLYCRFHHKIQESLGFSLLAFSQTPTTDHRPKLRKCTYNPNVLRLLFLKISIFTRVKHTGQAVFPVTVAPCILHMFLGFDCGIFPRSTSLWYICTYFVDRTLTLALPYFSRHFHSSLLPKIL